MCIIFTMHKKNLKIIIIKIVFSISANASFLNIGSFTVKGSEGMF